MQKTDFKNLNEIKGEVSARQKVLEEERKVKEQKDNEYKQNFISISGHDKKWQYPRRNNDQLAIQPFKRLKSISADSNEKSMYLIASFNHWFPIKMISNEFSEH